MTVQEDLTAVGVRELSASLFERLALLDRGTPEYSYVRGTLIEINLGLVHYAARRFRSRPDQLEDTVQAGTIGLIKAIDRYDRSFERDFISYALPTILGELKRFFRETSWSVRVPRRLQESWLTLARTGDRLAAELGRAPTVAELAKELDVTEEQVLEARSAATAYTADSLDAPIEADRTGSVLGDRVGYEDPALAGVENLHALAPLIRSLTERERAILSLRFGAELTQTQIGNELGISQMQVSRILSGTLAKLRAQLLTDR